ncbi:MAG: hypothetical protein MK066_09650 [Crocinitomicaceae bacterium]|nr:hypothetical protein [Crocinitomicaceae bacterium]
MKASFFTLITTIVLCTTTAKADQLIQIIPYYPYNVQYMPKGHMLTTSILSGLNLSSIAINGYQMKNNSFNLTLPIIGIGTGIGQVITGVVYYRNELYDYYYGYYGYNDYHQFNNRVSMMDIGLGTLSTAFNTYALIRAIKGRKNRSDLSWNIFGYKNPQNQQLSMGFTFRKQI